MYMDKLFIINIYIIIDYIYIYIIIIIFFFIVTLMVPKIHTKLAAHFGLKHGHQHHRIGIKSPSYKIKRCHRAIS